jgi:hypothetical protein
MSPSHDLYLINNNSHIANRRSVDDSTVDLLVAETFLDGAFN